MDIKYLNYYSLKNNSLNSLEANELEWSLRDLNP